MRENWTEERFRHTAEWFIKNHRYTAWTIADWFSYSVKVYTQAGKNKLIAEGHTSGEFEAYKLPDGDIVWKVIDGQSLPFPKFDVRSEYERRLDGLDETLDHAFVILERGDAKKFWDWFFAYGHYVDFLPEPRCSAYKAKQNALCTKFAGEPRKWEAKPKRGAVPRREDSKNSGETGWLATAADFARRCEEFKEERRERQLRRLGIRPEEAELAKQVELILSESSAKPPEAVTPLEPVKPIEPEPAPPAPAQAQPPQRSKQAGPQHKRHASPDHPPVHAGAVPAFSKHIDFIFYPGDA